MSTVSGSARPDKFNSLYTLLPRSVFGCAFQTKPAPPSFVDPLLPAVSGPGT